MNSYVPPTMHTHPHPPNPRLLCLTSLQCIFSTELYLLIEGNSLLEKCLYDEVVRSRPGPMQDEVLAYHISRFYCFHKIHFRALLAFCSLCFRRGQFVKFWNSGCDLTPWLFATHLKHTEGYMSQFECSHNFCTVSLYVRLIQMLNETREFLKFLARFQMENLLPDPRQDIKHPVNKWLCHCI